LVVKETEAFSYLTLTMVAFDVFYVTEEGVIYDPLSEEAAEIISGEPKSGGARDRLSKKLADRKKEEQQHQEHHQQAEDVDSEEEEDCSDDDYNSRSGDDDDYDSKDKSNDAERQLRLLEFRLKHSDLVTKQKVHNRTLAREHANFSKKANSSKALPAQFHHKIDVADNAAKRAIVHHTGSHYHMAGSKQFQRGVRVKGVISRHSKQGAKMQAARVSSKNMFTAREDAKGQRTTGGKSVGKQKKKSKNVSAKSGGGAES
jgi:hypothetical protein